MAFEEILQTYILPYVPTITAVGGVVASMLTVVKNCKGIAKQDLTATQKLKAIMTSTTDVANKAMEENIELRKIANDCQESLRLEIDKMKEELKKVNTTNRELIQQNKELAEVKDQLATIIQQNQALLAKEE